MFYLVAFQSFSISRNPVVLVKTDVFRGHPLTELDIWYSQLENYVSLAHNKLTLEKLTLYHGNIHYLPKDYFHGCRSLRRVKLGWNRIASVPDLGYISKTLYSLKLSGNHLSSINVLDNITFPVLDNLLLRDNFISCFDVTSLLRMPSLRVLYLSKNNFTHLRDPTNFIVRKRLFFKLDKNPWHCGNNLSWMLHWDRIDIPPPELHVMVWAIFKNFDIRDMVDVECYAPDNLQGIKLWKMSKSISSLIILIKR